MHNDLFNKCPLLAIRLFQNFHYTQKHFNLEFHIVIIFFEQISRTEIKFGDYKYFQGSQCSIPNCFTESLCTIQVEYLYIHLHTHTYAFISTCLCTRKYNS